MMKRPFGSSAGPLLVFVALLLIQATGAPGSSWACPAREPTLIVAVTATPLVTLSPTTPTAVPSATAVPPVTASPTVAGELGLTSTVAPSATATPPPTIGATATPPTATPSPVVAAWASPTPKAVVPVLGVSVDSPIIWGALIFLGAIILLAVVLLIAEGLRRRRHRDQPEEAAPEEVEESLVLTGPVILANRYVLMEEIGQGALGKVYKAVDSVLNRTVAVKVVRSRELRRAQDEGRSAGEGLFFEAQTTAQLQHPNIVVIYDVREWGDEIPLYVVMEYLEGTTLATILEAQQGQPLDDELTFKVATSVLRALVHAHTQGVVHRDLKPGNIMLMGAGPTLEVKVLDFGLAYRAQDVQAVPHSLREGNLVGTPSYMAPEQVKGERPGEPADLYAFGVLLFYMVTGQLPYTGRTARELGLKHLQSPIPDARAYRVDLRDEVVNLLMQLLQKDSRRRPATAADVLQVLENLGGRLTVSARGVAPRFTGGGTPKTEGPGG